MLVISTSEHFINNIKLDQQLYFHLKAILFILSLMAINKSEIWFQYLIYYIKHTCNRSDNSYTAIPTSSVYVICFNVEEI